MVSSEAPPHRVVRGNVAFYYFPHQARLVENGAGAGIVIAKSFGSERHE
jgi:hypothetical protein